MPGILRSGSLRTKTKSEENSPPSVSKRRTQTKKELPEENENKVEPVRNVEEIRRKNLEDNKAFLEGLLMTQIRDDLKSLANTLQPTVKKEAKKRDNKYITVAEKIPVRRSRRLAHMDVDGNKIPSPEESDNEMDTTKDQSITSIVYRRQSYKREIEISPEEQEALNQKIQTFFEQNDSTMDSKKSIYEFSDLQITDENVLKLTPDRLLFMDIHSRSDILAIIGCDRKGTIGLVVKSIDDLNGPWCKINYNFHTNYATCCRFDNFNSNIINSTSYDSTFRACDITKNQSIEILKDSDNHGLTAFDYRSLQTCVIAEDNGDVLLADIRANPVSIERFDVSKKRIRTLHINPMQTDEFCISGSDNCAKVWDLRNMSTMKYCLQTNYSCYGAYYNQAGSHIMATSRDDHIMSFSCHDMEYANDPLDIQPIKKIHHTNYVNRFVTPFTAQPYPIFESYFLIGSSGYPRAVTTVNISHRTLPIIVGGNSSGRIHVFTGHI
ncbi:unnamed protein product [Rotaria sp. Silwood1]|nr:unnamed protein product [Rotaria sp. Silwood1]CAF1372996.1 unnamed protein product [Rotaria sp. Silwood1]CAF3516930.1 unnamed protein product [Rotaria sp. Silwood1]CAF4633222.1 unnamed protein product [Rotaria sp. Silwood1]